MASRKIIFLIVVGILGLLTIIGIVSLAKNREIQQNNKLASLSIWVVGGTSEDYWKIFSGFNGVAEIYKETILDIRVFPNYAGYRDILLSTLADGNGPDIFMIEGGGDDLLAAKSVPIPEPLVNLTDYEKRYEDIFLPLLSTEGEGENMVRTIKGVPIGYETLGVFYNKSYFPTVPKTWNEVDLLYTNNSGYFPVNIGLGPRYTPDATDIIAYFLLKNGVNETKNLSAGGQALEEYLKFGTTGLKQSPIIESDSLSDTVTDTVNDTVSDATAFLPAIGGATLGSLRKEYDETGFSTLDSFIRGKIGMIIGFPSTIREIEKAEKRAGQDATTGLILTERLPQNSLAKGRMNIARYRYLALSAKSANPLAGADFLNYLMTETTLASAADAFPYLISPDRTINQTQGQKSISSIFARARLDSFIPAPGEIISVYNYGLKTEYEKIFEDSLDRNEKIDINNTLSRIKDGVDCKIESSVGGVLSDKCLR